MYQVASIQDLESSPTGRNIRQPVFYLRSEQWRDRRNWVYREKSYRRSIIFSWIRIPMFARMPLLLVADTVRLKLRSFFPKKAHEQQWQSGVKTGRTVIRKPAP